MVGAEDTVINTKIITIDVKSLLCKGCGLLLRNHGAKE
jgi:hypothetical protein